MLTVVLLLITVASQGLTITSSSGTLRREATLTTRSEAFLIPTTVIVPIGRARRVLVSASANDRGVYRALGSHGYTAARCNRIGGRMRIKGNMKRAKT